MKFQYVLLVAFLASCGEKKTAGKEAGACYGNGTCDEGLVCEEKVCVAMYPASALGGAEKFVADVCACKSKACVHALYESPGAAVFENVEEKRVQELEAKYEECVYRVSVEEENRVKKEKSLEAITTLKRINESVKAYYGKYKKLPEAAYATPRALVCCSTGGQCAPNPATWDTEPWKSLGFKMDTPHYYSYAIKRVKNAGNESITLEATGDLDCDNRQSTFTLYGEVVDGKLESADDVIVQQRLE